MRFYTELPKDYSGEILDLPPFNKKGKITKRVKIGVENSLYLYSNLAKMYAKEKENNPKNFLVDDIYVIGSGARENRRDSDLDLMLICPQIDERSAEDLKLITSYILFCDRPKREAIDLFIRLCDKYPKRASAKITNQVSKILEKYNSILR